MFFCKIEELVRLEENQKWKESVEYLYNLWKSNPQDNELFLRLVSESWYILSEYEVLNLKEDEISFEKIKDLLNEVVSGYCENKPNEKCNLFLGYIFTMTPYLFNDSTDVESLGKSLLKECCNKNPTSLSKTLFYGSTTKYKKDYIKSKKILQKDLMKIFSTDTEVERYFLDVLGDGNYLKYEEK